MLEALFTDERVLEKQEELGMDACNKQRKVSRSALNSRRIRLSAFYWLCSATCLYSSGCAMFNSSRDAEYEVAKRAIESDYGNGITRPEGVTADKHRLSSPILDKLGLGSNRRKDKDLAIREYQFGEEAFNKAKTLTGTDRRDGFRLAAKKFKSAAKNWQSSGLEQDALMMAGESLFFAEDYYDATEQYVKLVKEYPRNRYLDQVDSRRLEIADFWLKHPKADNNFMLVNFVDNKLPINDTDGHARRVLDRMRLDNPTGKVSDDATMRLAVDSYARGQYEGAADTFSDLRMTYPDSPHQFMAQFLELQSLMNSYQGPAYSSVPLEEAEVRVKQIAKQFPNEAGERQKDLNTAFAKIRFLKAERLWHSAEYRRNRSEIGSAKIHYQDIINEYSDTPFAEEARTQLSKIEGLPDDPPQRLPWLVKIFGDSKKERPLFDTPVQTK